MNNKDHYKTAICVYWTPLSYMKDREQTNPDLYAHRQQEQGSAWLYCISYIIYFVQYLSLRFITCILDICRPWERIARNNGQLRKKFSELNGSYYASFDTIWVYYPASTVHIIY